MPDIQLGLIGKTLKHSFSKKYFSEKFSKENIQGVAYDLFELPTIEEVEKLFKIEHLKGFNITIPYKEDIFPYLDSLDHSAEKIGAVNVVKINDDGSKTGYNSDYYGFKTSLENWAPIDQISSALILGTGGASKAIKVALDDLGIKFNIISRDKTKGDLSYSELMQNELMITEYQLIINCTPLGTFPDIDSKPSIPYQALSNHHYLYDLVYNPEETAFMKAGLEHGAKVKNGLEMLILQAEKSWEIWNV